jgi:uncharacterized membrane protein YphA (DoxX/SURF4 family)
MAAITGKTNVSAVATATWNEELINQIPARAERSVVRSNARTTLWTGRILSGIPVLFLIFDGVMKLFNVAPVMEAQNQLGLPGSLTLTIGMLELACVLLYAIPRSSIFGAILLTGYLGGAVAIQLRVGNPLFSHLLFPTYVGGLLWAGLYLRDRRLRVLLPFTRSTTVVGQVQRRQLSSASKRMNVALWTVQTLLALVFLFAGSTKLLLSIETLTSMGSPNQVALPFWFIRFIGVAEVLGAVGLILPRLLGIRPRLTSWAAAGLVIIMIGATAITISSGDVGAAIVPLVVGILSTFVAVGRRN